MFSKLPHASAVILAVGISLGFPFSASAQSGVREDIPKNAAAWHAILDREIDRALRRSNTALNMHARNTGEPLIVTFSVARDGEVTDVQVDETRGAAMAAAYRRSLSNMDLPLFSPDMQEDSLSYSMELTTRRR